VDALGEFADVGELAEETRNPRTFTAVSFAVMDIHDYVDVNYRKAATPSV